MSTAPGPAPEFMIGCRCTTCGKEIYSSSSTSEQQAKQDFARAVTLSETHDCKQTPKK